MPIVGLNSLRRKDDDDDDKKKGNEYFAGGLGSHGGGSGLAVVGGPNSNEPKCIITLYKNGYKMEDKEFCKKDDTKEHERFYASLIEGYVPHDLENEVRTKGLKVIVEDKRSEDFHIPPPRFGYVGNKLGTSVSPSEPSPKSSGNHKHLQYDSSKPKTPIRIRSCLGRVITLEVTEDWDYEDLYNAVAENTPGLAFSLLGGFPPKKLEADGTNVLASGLGGSAIRQVRQ